MLASALDMIGNTPLIALDRIHRGPGRLLAKAEFIQPGGSVKDRAALAIIEDAYRTGELVKGQPVVEMTSGNMGAGLAVVCNVLGNPFVATMSRGNSPERARMLRSLGAELILVPQVNGTLGKVTGPDIEAAVEEARRIAEERGAYYVNQFYRDGCMRAHEEGTGPELWKEMGSAIDAFVAAVGSGGTFVGTSRFLKRSQPNIRCYAVEPQGAEVLAGKPLEKPGHMLQGTGYGLIPPHWEAGLADGFFSVSDEEATEFRQRLANEEGLHVGYSAAANVCAAIKLLQSRELGAHPNVITMLCDTGLKY